MSLWFPVMVNSTQIGSVTIVRQEELKSVRSIHDYAYVAIFHRIQADGRPGAQQTTVHGTVKHRYDKGWAALVTKVLRQVDTGYLS